MIYNSDCKFLLSENSHDKFLIVCLYGLKSHLYKIYNVLLLKFFFSPLNRELIR